MILREFAVHSLSWVACTTDPRSLSCLTFPSYLLAFHQVSPSSPSYTTTRLLPLSRRVVNVFLLDLLRVGAIGVLAIDLDLLLATIFLRTLVGRALNGAVGLRGSSGCSSGRVVGEGVDLVILVLKTQLVEDLVQ